MVADHSCHRCGVLLQVLHAEVQCDLRRARRQDWRNIAKAEQARKDADEAKAKYEARLDRTRPCGRRQDSQRDTRAEASRIIADARSRAESDAAQITASAQRSIESQHQQAIVSLKGEVGALATALHRKILGAKLEDNDVQSSMMRLDDRRPGRQEVTVTIRNQKGR